MSKKPAKMKPWKGWMFVTDDGIPLLHTATTIKPFQSPAPAYQARQVVLRELPARRKTRRK